MAARGLTQNAGRQSAPAFPSGKGDAKPPMVCQLYVLTGDEERFLRLRELLASSSHPQFSCRVRRIKNRAEIGGSAKGICLYDAVALDEAEALEGLRDWPTDRLPLIIITSDADLLTQDDLTADCLPEAQLDAFNLTRAVRHAWQLARAAEQIADLQRLDRERQEQAQMLRAIVTNLPVVAGRIDPDGIVTHVTGSLSLEYGLDAKYLLGRNVLTLYPESAARVRRALAGEVVDFSWSGVIVGLEKRLHVHLFFDAKCGEGAFFFARDVTESERTERALAASRQQFQLLLERSLDAILLMDDTGACIEANQAACTMLGRPRKNLVGCRAAEFGFDRFEPLQADSLVKNHFQSAAMSHSCAFVRPDGQVRLMEYSMYRASPYFHLCILRDITERLRLEREILEVSDSEQRRFSQDLHDGLGQHLTGVGYMSEALASKLAARCAPEAEVAAQIAELIGQANTQARDIARSLFPVELCARHLPDALREIALQAQQIYGIDCRLEVECDALPLSDAAAMHLYRIANEAVNNSRRHGKARVVSIGLRCSNKQITLKVEDDGSGFQSSDDTPKQGGLGLHMMQYRARLLGSQLKVQSSPLGGVSIMCSVQGHLPDPRPSKQAA